MVVKDLLETKSEFFFKYLASIFQREPAVTNSRQENNYCDKKLATKKLGSTCP